jgi:SDR family mycofactocin-dependent oxidoreductase
VGLLDGKVAYITGAARGQGRSHAVLMAQEGANIIATDICEDIPDGTMVPLAREADLEETARLVEATGQKIVIGRADVRNFAELSKAAAEGIAAFGKIDIVCANAGIVYVANTWEIPEEAWDAMIDTNLKGVWNTVRATLPSMLEQGTGGSIIITTSNAAHVNMAGTAHYSAAKSGAGALARVLANELGWLKSDIRVNCVEPTSVFTNMVNNEVMFKRFRPDLEQPTVDDVKHLFYGQNLLHVPWVDPIDISRAVVWLASEHSRYVTGIALPVDAGSSIKMPGMP